MSLLPSRPSGTGFSPSLTALSSRLPLWLGRSGVPVGTPAWSHNPAAASATAHMHGTGLGSSPFARHYLGSVSLFLGVLRCFSSPGSHHLAYRFSQGRQPAKAGRLPHSGTSGSVPAHRLPGAFRSAPRPSSACNAKASTTDVCSLTALSPYLAYLLRSASPPSDRASIRPTGGAGPGKAQPTVRALSTGPDGRDASRSLLCLLLLSCQCASGSPWTRTRGLCLIRAAL